MTRSRHSALALATISAAQLIIVLDATIVFVALPAIHRGLHFSTANLVWVTVAYALTFGGLLPLGGRAGDLFGRRRMFMTGTAVFALASLVGGFAQNDVCLIVTRAAQGAGGALTSPAALSLIATNFAEGPARNRAMGVYAGISGAGTAIGLLVGGLLTELVSWRAVLFVNVPIALVVLLLAPRVLAESEGQAGGRLDVPGAVTVTSGMVLLVYGLTNASNHGWTSPGTVGCLVAAAALLAVFVVIETRARRPLMPLDIFTSRNRCAAYGMMLCFGAAMFASLYFMTQYLQDVLGYSSIMAGLGFLPMSATIVIMSQVAARLVGRIGIRAALLIGPVCAAGGLLWLSRLTPGSGYGGTLPALLLMAAGLGFSFVPLTLTAVAGVRPGESGLAAALLNTCQQIGGSTGLALLSTVAAHVSHSRARQLADDHHGQLTVALQHAAVVHGYDRSFLIATGLVGLTVLISVAVVRPLRAQAAVPEPLREVAA
ncbi:drug resistance transporter, EmrB/QacA subfamily [Frankia torreyi]|uniref:Drug resistance transporter, EmrB/QacA subfamily n=1 Tax=Frankia torreyi TaxID=1856 RepID=A0A0D8B9X6_9ACTN|nr:MFS transporter [Frankia torreyi]KJE21083.1 drug resistance transporter, EmrB/QacA subfamily [Frankia torreyi]